MKSQETVQVTTRLPKDLVNKIERLAEGNSRSRNKIVQMACEEYVERHAPEGQMPIDELKDLPNHELISKILEENREIKKRIESLEEEISK